MFVTATMGGNALIRHLRRGRAALALLLFRLAWGIGRLGNGRGLHHNAHMPLHFGFRCFSPRLWTSLLWPC
jgi:hypothetical protein